MIDVSRLQEVVIGSLLAATQSSASPACCSAEQQTTHSLTLALINRITDPSNSLNSRNHEQIRFSLSLNLSRSTRWRARAGHVATATWTVLSVTRGKTLGHEANRQLSEKREREISERALTQTLLLLGVADLNRHTQALSCSAIWAQR